MKKIILSFLSIVLICATIVSAHAQTSSNYDTTYNVALDTLFAQYRASTGHDEWIPEFFRLSQNDTVAYRVAMSTTDSTKDYVAISERGKHTRVYVFPRMGGAYFVERNVTYVVTTTFLAKVSEYIKK